MTVTTSQPGGSPVCPICGEVLAAMQTECPKCGCPISQESRLVPTADNLKSARDRFMSLARTMPGIAQNAKSIDSLCQQFLDVVVVATDAVHGVVWDLGTGQHWLPSSRGPAPETVFTASHQALLKQVYSHEAGTTLLPNAVDNPIEFLLVLRPFSTPTIPQGVVELLQRPDAPKEAAAGYLQFLDQMTVYFENSSVLGTVD